MASVVGNYDYIVDYVFDRAGAVGVQLGAFGGDAVKAVAANTLALGGRHELAVHLRGAMNNGCTKAELQEIIVHAGCYCGWPAAVDGFRIAKEVLDSMELEEG